MRVFAFECITGGGLLGRPFEPSLAREGSAMVAALVRDLSALPGITVLVGQDPRIDLPKMNATWLIPRRDELAEDFFARSLSLCDAVWPIAPETARMLERISIDVLAKDKVLLGSRPAAVAVAASKRATALAMRQANISAAECFGLDDAWPQWSGPWVVKPDDGAGCSNTRIFADAKVARAFMVEAQESNLIAQRWLEGNSLSLSLLCKDGQADLLSVNSQHIFLQDGQVSVDGLLVNALQDNDGAFRQLAQWVAAALPGLWGYVGIDLVRTDHGDTVLDINPRLTTSYCGLRAALDLNVAEQVISLLRKQPLAALKLGAGKSVEINVGMDYGD